MFNLRYGGYTFNPGAIGRGATVRVNSLVDIREQLPYGGPYNTISSLGILTMGDIPASRTDAYTRLPAANMIPNSFTDSNGITYAWVQGNGW